MYSEHPECFNKSLPVRTVIQLFKMGDYIVNQLQTKGINVPLLIQYGNSDPTCSKEGFDLLFAQNRSEDKKMIGYDGMHCITHDTCVLKVLEDLTNWLIERAK